MRNRLAVTLIAVLTTMALSAACSPETGDTPEHTAQPSQSQQPDVSLPRGGAPKVLNPVKTAKFETQPCSVASMSQLKLSGFEMRKTESRPENPSAADCKWYFKTSGYGAVVAGFINLHNEGLTALYERRDSYILFDEIPSIAGYPAVIYGTSDRRSAGRCVISIGLRDDQNYEVSTGLISSNPDYTNPCKVAQKIAEIAVTTMKKAAS